jgi:hypothetical protein
MNRNGCLASPESAVAGVVVAHDRLHLTVRAVDRLTIEASVGVVGGGGAASG